MLDHIWDIFLENSIALFIPIVCSYYALTENIFLNVSRENASGLEWVANEILTPFQYICGGKIAKETEDGSWKFETRFQYDKDLCIKSIIYIPLLPPSALLGSALKLASFLSKETRTSYASLIHFYNSKTIHLNTELYQALGIQSEEESFYLPEGYSRRPGDEKHLHIEKKALEDIAKALNKAGIAWWVDCGTCLGTHRYGGVIPWDQDLDIAVLLPDFDNVRRALSKLDQRKYIVQDWSSRAIPNSYIKVFIRESGTLIDVYHFAIDPQTKELRYILSLESNIFFPERWKIRERRFTAPVAFETVFPLKKSLFDGIVVNIPQNPEKYLQRYYGENLAPAKIYDPLTGLYEKDLSHPYWERAYAH